MRGCLVPKILTQEQAQGVGRGQVDGAAGAGAGGTGTAVRGYRAPLLLRGRVSRRVSVRGFDLSCFLKGLSWVLCTESINR